MRIFFLLVIIGTLCAMVFGTDNILQKENHNHSEHHEHLNKAMSFHDIAPYNAKFAFKLYRQVAADHPKENIFFSPISISTAFAMLSLGAKGTTLSQIIEGLCFNASEISMEEIYNGYKHLLHVLNSPDRELQLDSGNALFMDNDFKPLQKFLEDVNNFFESEVFSTDFHHPVEALKQINSFVEKKTRGKIVKALSIIDQDTLMILINYIYFRGQWVKPFMVEHTMDGEFHVDNETVVTVPMMHRTGRYQVTYDLELGCTVVEMPYSGNATALFILPEKGKLKQVEDALDQTTIENWKKKSHYRSIDLSIPKFSLSTTLDLEDTLVKMGMTHVFTNKNDLSGIVETTALMVSKAVHKAILEVDEKGTEAAGVTVIEVIPVSLPRDVCFCRPFILIIYDTVARSFLFTGRISKPK